MSQINVLDKHTIDQIAAGEVIEGPKNVVKELVENAIDAGANAITVEISDGGLTFIRVTDNGSGIAADDIRTAFLRHATSKIRDITDLYSVRSLGFRGEALSSIAAVSLTEVISKPKDALCGIRYCADGGEERVWEEIGAPEGTTFIVRNLFFNTPARKKFLKSAKTEGAYIATMMERLAFSHPDIAFHFIVNRAERFHTSGNGDMKDLIYRIFGRETAANVRPLHSVFHETVTLNGFLGEPSINRSNRHFELFFVNGRFVNDEVLQRALEDGYSAYLMQHKFPFAILHLTLPPGMIDVNVHPAKTEIRFHNAPEIHEFVKDAVMRLLNTNEMIPDVEKADRIYKDVRPVIPVNPDVKDLRTGSEEMSVVTKAQTEHAPEPFEQRRMAQVARDFTPKQLSLFSDEASTDSPHVLTKDHRDQFRIIGQVFGTYWLFEHEDNLYLIDQHAAHEKVNYERFLKRYQNRTLMTQMINPPQVMTFTAQEESMFLTYRAYFKDLGFVVDEFGDRTYVIREIPMDLYGSASAKEMFIDILDDLTEEAVTKDPDVITTKIASMACKASVKGSTLMHEQEIEALLDELLTLDNPYNCPHGRPTIITMSKYELDKRFKRIVS